jgi:3-deoxy-7-phosphoheptulonate synthase
LEKVGLPVNIMVDCSHGNSSKNPELQPLVAENCVNQILEGNHSLVGLMLESNLCAGNQTIPADRRELRYGVSITDGCIGWESTSDLLLSLHEKLATSPRLQRRRAG